MKIKETYFYTWKDERTAGGGAVTDTATGRIYGATSHDTDSDLKAKFIALSLFQACFSPFRFSYRVLSLVTLDFAVAGYKSAKLEWLRERQKVFLSKDINRILLLPNGSNLFWKTAIHITTHLVVNIFKISTYILIVIGLQFAALYGIFMPLDGRAIYSRLEEIGAKRGPYDFPFPLIGNYSAPCMQPKDVWDKQNWYSWQEGYNANDYKSLLLKIQNISIEQKKFLKTEEMEFAQHEKLLEQAHAKWTSLAKPLDWTENTIEILQEIIGSMEAIPLEREEVVKAFEKNDELESKLSALNATKAKLEQSFQKLSIKISEIR